MSSSPDLAPTLSGRFRANWLRIVLACIVLLLPAIQLVVMLQVFFGASVFEYVPWTDDEMVLWHQELTFSVAGFNGGYYGFEENPPLLQAIHFHAHGPFFPMLYGALGRLIGWQPYTGVILNLIFVTLAIGFFLVVTRPNVLQLVFLGAILLTDWSLVFQIPSTSQDAVHLAFAIAAAAVFFSLIKKPNSLSPWIVIGFALLIFAMSLIRPFWALMLIPLALLAAPRLTLRLRLLALTGACLLIGASFLIYAADAAPYPYVTEAFREALKISRRAALNVWRDKFIYDIPVFLGLGDAIARSIVLRYTMLGLSLAMIFTLGSSFRSLDRNVSRFANANNVTLTILYSFASIVLIVFLTHRPYDYYGIRMFPLT